MFDRKERSHYKYESGHLVPKKIFKREDDALNFARWQNSLPNTVYKVIYYKCSECDGWHIGHNGSTLTSKDKEKARKKLEEYKQIKRILRK